MSHPADELPLESMLTIENFNRTIDNCDEISEIRQLAKDIHTHHVRYVHTTRNILRIGQ